VSSTALALPTRDLVLGRYRPFRPLGSGGSGSVWLALDEQNGLDVALKIIPREGKGAARAEREALAARRLRHERCVRAYDVGNDASHVYIAYEYVPGRTVREALQSDVLSDKDVVEVAAQVLDALAHAHRAGIVHRDVKPSNILLEDHETVSVRLLDFGLAQFDGADTLTAIGDVPGTLAYISPERLAGDDASPASDVWSVGVLLWEALGGRHPFWGMPLQEVARAIEAGAPPLGTERRDLPRRLLDTVDRSLARDAAERPRASELASSLRTALKTPQDRARRTKAPPTPTSTTRSATPLETRVIPPLLAATTAAIGATLLPFWPPALVAAIVVAAGAAAAYRPRLGLALALAAPVFPIGNEARSAAIVYGAFALGWLVLSWHDARRGLLFVAGPLLALFGALALVPLAVQPARGAVRRAVQAALAIIAAGFVAGVSGDRLPLADSSPPSLGVTPSDTSGDVLLALQAATMAVPVLVVAALVAAAAAVLLPWARVRSRYGVAAVGAVVLAAALATGPALASVPLLLAAWGAAAALAAKTGR
jgi:hypothetical protein